MELASIETAVIAACRVGLGDSFDVGWDYQAARMRDASHVRLRPQSIQTVGRDERRYGDADEDGMLERVYGVRRLVIQVLCESQAQSLANNAHAISDTLRSSLESTAAQNLLGDAGLGRARLSNPRDVTYYDDSDRRRSAVVFDMTFNAVTVSAERLIGWIQTVTIDGTVDGIPINTLTVESD